MDWISDDLEQGLRERRFAVTAATRRVPGILWTAPHTAPRGLVLLGHGAAGHKRMAYVLAVARRLVTDHGLAAAAIDGPVHGERRADPAADEMQVFRDFQASMAQGDLIAPMVEDWTAALDGLQALDELAQLPVAFWGLSMGTLLGLSFVAQEPRVRAALFGLMGSGSVFGDRLGDDAAQLRCPVLFLVQWDDELIPRELSLSLFDLIGSKHKALHANPGKHAAVPGRQMVVAETFLAEQLASLKHG